MKKYTLMIIAILGLNGCYSNASVGSSVPIGKHGVGSSSIHVNSSGQVYTHAGVGGYL